MASKAYLGLRLIDHYIKYARIRVFTDPHSPADSVLMRESTGQWKPVFWHILCSEYFSKSSSICQSIQEETK